MLFVAALLLSIAPSCDEALQSAVNALRQQDAKAAEGILQAASQPCGRRADFFALRGVASQMAGDLAQAQSFFENSLLLRAGDPVVLTRLGAIYFQEQRLPDAVRVLSNALQADPKNVAAGKLLAGSYVALKKWKSADEVFGKFGLGPASNPLLSEPLTVMWFAETLIEMQPSRIGAELSPNAPGMTPDLLFALGGLFAKHRLYDQEIRFLRKIPEQAADDAVYFNLGLAYSKLRQFDDARECFFKAIDKHPNHVDAYLHIGIDYASAGDKRKSVPWLIRAHQIAPERSDAAYAAAEGLADLQYFDTAKKVLSETVASTVADRAAIETATADVRLAEGDPVHAIDIYEKVLNFTSTSVPAMVGVARAKASQGKDAEAVAMLKRALSADPDNTVANAELGMLEAKEGVDKEALQHLNLAWRDDRSNTRVALALARLYEHQGKEEEALALLEPLESTQANSRDFQFELAKLHRALGQSVEAQSALERLAALEEDKKAPLRFDDPKVYVVERE